MYVHVPVGVSGCVSDDGRVDHICDDDGLDPPASVADLLVYVVRCSRQRDAMR